MTEQRLRGMQLAIVAAGFAGVIAELVLHEHWAEPWQVVPFFLCGAGLVAIAAFAVSPGETRARLLQVVMLAAAAGAVIGMVQHLQGNFGFEREIFPNAPFAEPLEAWLSPTELVGEREPCTTRLDCGEPIWRTLRSWVRS